MLPSLYRITGHTYPQRHRLREMGCRWNAALKSWEIRVSGNGWTDTVWSLRRAGCRVVRITPTEESCHD